jgi:hypothetical protein
MLYITCDVRVSGFRIFRVGIKNRGFRVRVLRKREKGS